MYLYQQLTRLEEEKLSMKQTISDLEASKESLSKEVEELLAKNQSLEKKLTSSKGQVRMDFPFHNITEMCLYFLQISPRKLVVKLLL